MRRQVLVTIAAMMLMQIDSHPAAGADLPKPSANPGWDPAAAARYLDARETWWQNWDHAKRDHGTFCVSCHTQATYAFARPALRARLGMHGLSEEEAAMLANLKKRVQAWDAMLPFYSDEVYGKGKEVESRNAESVLNAIILSNYDVEAGRPDDLTLVAFRRAWELETKTGPDAGSWVWQNFDYAPWESKESQYHWAALMAVQVAREPGRYAERQEVQEPLNALKGFLKNHYEAQPLLNQVVALWADEAFPGVVSPQQRVSLLTRLGSLQKLDGGWSASGLGEWHRRDGSPAETRSDGYATALIALVLEGIAGGAPDGAASRAGQLDRALAWLRANQDPKTGAWPAWSLNKNRDPQSGPGKFMSDAATAYATMALLRSTRQSVPSKDHGAR